MPKLITLNIEKNNHYSRVLAFLDKESPDIICLQEAPELFTAELIKRGYTTAYAPMFLKEIGGIENSMGVIIASKYPLSATKNYYHQAESAVSLYDPKASDKTIVIPYLIAEIRIDDTLYSVATTHMIDTDHGIEDATQIEITHKLLTLISKESPHILCGDFNMPRGFNRLYEEMITRYKDSVPQHYKSSLDRNLHRLGNKVLDEPIFDIFMVDYIFTQPPYIASEVRLQFGVSDHAAVIATISKAGY